MTSFQFGLRRRSARSVTISLLDRETQHDGTLLGRIRFVISLYEPLDIAARIRGRG